MPPLRRSHPPSRPAPKPAPLVDEEEEDGSGTPAAHAAAPAAAAAAAAPVAGQRRPRSVSAATVSAAVLRSVEGAVVGHQGSSTSISPAPSTPVPEASSSEDEKYFKAEAAKVTELCAAHTFLTRFDQAGQPNPELFKSCRQDLAKKYLVSAFCTSCAEAGRRKHNCFFMKSEALLAHVAQFHSGRDTAAVAAAGTPDALRMSVRATFALWAASSGLAEVHVRRFGDLLGSRLSATPVAMAQRALVSYERVVGDAADISDACVKRQLREQPFVAVSFDGGRWQHKGQYMLVTVAHSPAGMCVLRPHTSETPYDGKAIAACFTSTLHTVGSPILHAMVDGCTANEAGLKGVELLAQELAAVDLDSDEDEAAGEGVEDNEEKRRSALERLAETLRDVNMLDNATRYPKRLLCIAHWLKNRVLELQKGLSSEAMTAVSLLTKALFSPDGLSVRKGQLRRYIRDKRVILIKHNAGALIALASEISLLLDAMRSEDPEGADATFAAVKSGLVKEMASIQGDGISAAAIQSLAFDDPTAAELLSVVHQRLIAAASATKATPRAVRIATTNQTRWHSSVFASYAFLAEYLGYVRDFFAQPEKQTSDSAKELYRLLSNPETFAKILEDLNRYTSSLEPMAALMTAISDVSATRPMAHKMHHLYDQMRKKLAQQPADTPGRLLASMLDEYESEVRKDEKFSATLDTFWYVKLFVPGSLIARGDPYKKRQREDKLRASYVRLVFGFAESEFPETEWKLWDGHVREVAPRGQTYSDNPSLYWESDEAKAKFPTLHKAALYVLALPVAVTSCDSVISVMGASFSTRQNALSAVKSSAVLAFRCNGDIEQRTLDPPAFPRWGAKNA